MRNEHMANILKSFIIKIMISCFLKFSCSSPNHIVLHNLNNFTHFISQGAVKGWIVENLIIAVIEINKYHFYRPRFPEERRPVNMPQLRSFGRGLKIERFRYPCLGKLYLSWAKVDEPVWVYCALYAMRCTAELLRTSLAWAIRVYWVQTVQTARNQVSHFVFFHTIQLICSSTRENRSSFSSQAGPESRRTWERTVDRPSCTRWERPLSRVLLPFTWFPRLSPAWRP